MQTYMKTGYNLDQLKPVILIRRIKTGYLVQDENGMQYKIFEWQLVSL